MRNLVKLKSSIIVGKCFVIHMGITLATILTSFIIGEWVGGMAGLQIAWTIMAWVPMLSFMNLSKKIERDNAIYIQSRIPSDVEFCSDQELIAQIAVRNNGCMGIVIRKGEPLIYEKFDDKKQREHAAMFCTGWVSQVYSGIRAERGEKS